MSDAVAFSVGLFAPGSIVSTDESVRRQNAAVAQIGRILRPVVPIHRIGFDTPTDGTGLLIVRLRRDAQMSLDLEVEKKLSAIQQREAPSVAAVFRRYCESLISAIRRARLSRHDLEGLYEEAVAAQRELSRLAMRTGDGALAVNFRMEGQPSWTPLIAGIPVPIRASRTVFTMRFAVLSVGLTTAEIRVDKSSRQIVQMERAKTTLHWLSNEQPDMSARLFDLMHRECVVLADCSPLYRRSVRPLGFALHRLLD